MAGFWSPFDTEEKRARLAFLGGGIATIAAALWAVFTYVKPPEPTPKDKTTTKEEPIVTRDFLIGRWEVVLREGDYSRAFITDYLPDGTFRGSWTWFPGRIGTKEPYEGTWKITNISLDRFTLELTYLKGPPEWKGYQTCPSFPCQWSGTFKMIDRNHAQNIDDNYVALRKE